MPKALEPFFDVPPDFSTVLSTVKSRSRDEHLEPDFKYPSNVDELIAQLSAYWIVRCDGQHRSLKNTFHGCDLRLKNAVCWHTYSLWRLVEMAEMLTGYRSLLLNPDGKSRMSWLLMHTRWAIENCVHHEMKKDVDRAELAVLQDSYWSQILEEIQYLIQQLKYL